MIGTGSMGSMMAMLFVEHGCTVSMFDPSKGNMERAVKKARDAGFDESKIKAFDDYESLCKSLDEPKVICWSTPHGNVGDSIMDALDPYLEKGDIIMDLANEHYLNTQRRQGRAINRGVHYIGSGVSGGYQSAREGPSLSPSGDKRGLVLVMPFMQKIAAKDADGNACVAEIGPGGSGHYTKMVHNGIEQGIMSALCEVWGVMSRGLGMSYAEIADVWEEWNKEGELRDNFLISIGIDICRTQEPKSKKPLLDMIKDKVVQDADDSEGTGVWTCEEAMRLHCPVPTIAAAHQFRLASADANKRTANSQAAGGAFAEPSRISVDDREAFVEDLRLAMYSATLESFIQGLKLLAKADQENHWGINFEHVIAIWRAGCIIRSEHISEVFLKVYRDADMAVVNNPLQSPIVAKELQKTYSSLKKVVIKSAESDQVIPSVSATLEALKYLTTKERLPTMFMEAELDFFGEHMFDLPDGPGDAVTGRFHDSMHETKQADICQDRTTLAGGQPGVCPSQKRFSSPRVEEEHTI
jgi:6-phosphogluconate dehydrogenase